MKPNAPADAGFYESYAVEYASPLRRAWEQRASAYKVATLLPLMGTLRPRRILDYGCGLGDALDRLARHFQVAEAIGVDVSATAIESAARRYPAHRFVRGDLVALAALRADMITFFDVLEHLPDIPQALAAARNCADYVGIKIPLEKTWLIALLNRLGLKAQQSRLHASEGHLYEFSRLEVENLLRGAGLTDVRTLTAFPPRELCFGEYIERRMAAKTGWLARAKHRGYLALERAPDALSRPLLKVANGVDLFVFART